MKSKDNKLNKLQKDELSPYEEELNNIEVVEKVKFGGIDDMDKSI